jgi:CRISPR-associated protein Cas2
MNRRPAVIAYDISHPLRRRRVHRRLLQWRIDGQKSVHECLLAPREAEELYLQLGELIDPQKDRLLLAWLAPNSPVEARGTGSADSLFRRLARIR